MGDRGETMSKQLKIAVLLSGSGTTLANLLAWRARGELLADIDLVISSRSDAKGIDIARDAGIRTEVVASRDYRQSAREGEEINDWGSMSRDISKILTPGDYDLVCMAGFLSRYFIPQNLMGKVINIHPALIPMFCGQGMYGHHVHEKVIESGVRVTGCTVHFADNGYDTGPIILQRTCPVYTEDTPDTVAARVFQEECIAYPTAINLIAEGRVTLPRFGRVLVERDSEVARCSHGY